MVGEPKVVNVILSEAKNLVLVRDAADMPRSFAALRMTICRSFAEKIDTLFRGHDDEWDGVPPPYQGGG